MFFFIYPLCLGFGPKSLKKSKCWCKKDLIGPIFIKIRIIFANVHFLVVIYLKFDILGPISLLKTNFSLSSHYFNNFPLLENYFCWPPHSMTFFSKQSSLPTRDFCLANKRFFLVNKRFALPKKILFFHFLQ